MLNSLTTIFMHLFDLINHQIAMFIDWLVMKGVNEDSGIIILYAVGISGVLLVLGLLVALFNFLRKYKTKQTAHPKKEKTANPPVLDSNVEGLTKIETDMLALKELFDGGHINAKVYVEETRKLYEKAQKLI